MTPNNHGASTETIEEITDETSIKNDSDTNESEHSEPKDSFMPSKVYDKL